MLFIKYGWEDIAMVTQQFDAKYSYDYGLDLVNIEVEELYNHGMFLSNLLIRIKKMSHSKKKFRQECNH